MKVFESKVTMDNVKINLIKPMTNSPFTVKEDKDMQKLRESISQFGLLSSIVIRQLPDTNEYEIVCGNRRLQILNELGYETAPVLINNLSAFAFVNDNIDLTSARIKVYFFIMFYFCVLVN